MIITEKADMKKAVEGVVRAAYGFCGQKCSAASRVYVQRSVKNVFLAALKNRLKEVRVMDPGRGTCSWAP